MLHFDIILSLGSLSDDTNVGTLKFKGTKELRGTHTYTHLLVQIIWSDLVWNTVPMLSGVFRRCWVAAGVTSPPCHTGVSAAAPPAVACPPQPCLDVHEEGGSAWNEALVLFLVHLFIYLAWLLHYPPAALLFFHLHASSADMRSVAFLHHPIFIVCLAKDQVVLQEELVSNTKPGQMKQSNRTLHHHGNRNLLEQVSHQFSQFEWNLIQIHTTPGIQAQINHLARNGATGSPKHLNLQVNAGASPGVSEQVIACRCKIELSNSKLQNCII